MLVLSINQFDCFRFVWPSVLSNTLTIHDFKFFQFHTADIARLCGFSLRWSDKHLQYKQQSCLHHKGHGLQAKDRSFPLVAPKGGMVYTHLGSHHLVMGPTVTYFDWPAIEHSQSYSAFSGWLHPCAMVF